MMLSYKYSRNDDFKQNADKCAYYFKRFHFSQNTTRQGQNHAKY
jgi:hypothetical protein